MSYASLHIMRDGPGAYEPECSRTTNRLRAAAAIIMAQAEWHPHDHVETCPRHPDRLGRVLFTHREGVCCNCGRDRNPGHWDAFVTSELCDQAYKVADALISARGSWHQAKINDMKRHAMGRVTSRSY